MTVGLKLTTRLVVLTALVNYSFGLASNIPPTVAANIAVASSANVPDIFQDDDPADLSAGVTDFLSDDDTNSSGSESSSTASSTDSTLFSTPASSSSEFISVGEITTEAPISASSTTTTTTMPTTTTHKTPPAGSLEPDFGAAPPFKMTFSIGFLKLWNASYTDCSSPECLSHQIQVQTQIDVAFTGCPGYTSGSIAVLNFYFGPPDASEVLTAQIVEAKNGSELYTYARYTASFASKIILSQGADVVSYIDLVVAVKLANNSKVIDGSTSSMANDANNQVSEFTEDPCPTLGMAVCPLCYPCIKDAAYQYNTVCVTECREDQVCTIEGNNTIGCICKENYLPVGDDCVHEDWIIGLSAGIGGAIVLGLLIAAIVLGCKLKKKDKKCDHLMESQNHHRPAAYEMIRHDDSFRDRDRDRDNNTHGGQQHDKEGHDNELATFSRTDNDEPPLGAAAAAVIVVTAAEEDAVEAEHHHQQQQQHEVEVKQVERKDDSHLGSNLESAADYDNVSTASHQPGSSKAELDDKQSDYYRSLYYTLPDDHSTPSGHVDPYNSFKPQLIKIDANKEYVIKRPNLQPTNGNHYDYNKSYF